jgi:RNA polymerase sigma factor (TIGR02999 family)
MTASGDVTQLLVAYREGDKSALDRLIPLIYDDLRRIAGAHIARGPANPTLQATGLVNEAYLRLVDQTRADWRDRQHFLSVCARAMRQIVVSNVRRHLAAKRGGGQGAVPIEENVADEADRPEWLLDLDQALDRLAAHDERLARVVECRYFAGFTEEETAEILGSSVRTVQRDWRRARAWLRRDLEDSKRDA